MIFFENKFLIDNWPIYRLYKRQLKIKEYGMQFARIIKRTIKRIIYLQIIKTVNTKESKHGIWIG